MSTNPFFGVTAPIEKVVSPLQGRTTPPKGYAPIPRPIGQPILAHPMPMPTPPSQGNAPAASLRSPLPGILADPDQVRQVYGKGTIIRRFWPLQV